MNVFEMRSGSDSSHYQIENDLIKILQRENFFPMLLNYREMITKWLLLIDETLMNEKDPSDHLNLFCSIDLISKELMNINDCQKMIKSIMYYELNKKEK